MSQFSTGSNIKATAASSWYPDYPAVMNIAKSIAWGRADLFPQFGMPSL
jgi:hypothetical protein